MKRWRDRTILSKRAARALALACLCWGRREMEAACAPPGSEPSASKSAESPLDAGIGHVNVSMDLDGSVRREVPIVKYGDSYFPSCAMRLIMAHMGMPTTDAVFTPGSRSQRVRAAEYA